MIYITKKDAAKITGRSINTINYWIKHNLLTIKRKGLRTILIELESLRNIVVFFKEEEKVKYYSEEEKESQ